MKYHFKIHKEGVGYWAECIELKGCSTQADSLPKLERNIHEALNAYLDEPRDSKLLLPMPRKRVSGKNIREVEVDPRLAFAVQLRNLRLRHGLTQKQVADKLGMKGLYTYQRLESSKTANPEWVTVAKIKRIFPEFGLDDLAA